MTHKEELPQKGNIYFYHLIHNNGPTKCLCFKIVFGNGDEYHFAYRNHITLTDAINHHIIGKKNFVLLEGNLLRVISKEEDSNEKVIVYDTTSKNKQERKMYDTLDKLLIDAGL